MNHELITAEEAEAAEEERIYQRNFLILRVLQRESSLGLLILGILLQVFVRCSVIVTLILLAIAFGYVFLTNWNNNEGPFHVQNTSAENRRAKGINDI